MERFSYYENAPSDGEDDSDSTIFLQDISGHINTNYDTGYDTLSNQSHSFDTGPLTPIIGGCGTLRSNISDTGTLKSSRSSNAGSVKSDTGTLKSSSRSNTGTLQSDKGILRGGQDIVRSEGTSTPKGRKSEQVRASPNDMSVAAQQLQVIPIQKDISQQQQQPHQLQQFQQQQQPQQSPGFPGQFNFQPPIIMADISHSMLSMEQNMKRMQRQMEEQFRAMSMGSPMGPPAMMMPQMDTFGTFPRIKSPFAPEQQHLPQQDDRGGLLTIAGPRSPAPSTVSTIGPSSASSLSPPSPSISSSTTTDDQAYIMDRNGKKHLKMQFDMQDFKPEEVKVKKDRNRLEVSALHEEKEPNRVSCRVFHQQYHLPKDVRLTKVDSKFSPDGTLTVESAVKPRHRVKFAVEDGANPPQLAIEPPSPPTHSGGNTDVLVTTYPNGVNGTPPFPVQDQQALQLQQQQLHQQQQQSKRHNRHKDDRQVEGHFKADRDRQNRTVRELTPEDDYEWPDYTPPKMEFSQKRHQELRHQDQRHQDQRHDQQIMDYPPPQRIEYQQSHRPDNRQDHRPDYRQEYQSPTLQRVDFQQQRKEYTPPQQIDFQVKPSRSGDYKNKTKSLDRRQLQKQNNGARIQDYQQEDAFVRGHDIGRQPELSEGVAQVYVSNTPSTIERSMSADLHGNPANARSYGTLNRSRSPPKPPKRTDSHMRYNTLPNRKLAASEGQSQRVHDGFASLQRPPPPNYHQLSYLTLNGDVSPAPSSSSGSTVATAYNTYYNPHHGHYHRN